jgi:type IV pilus assembly protein PilB
MAGALPKKHCRFILAIPLSLWNNPSKEITRMAAKRQAGKISDILIRNNAINADDMLAAEEEAGKENTRLEKYLIEKKLVKREDMTLALSEYLKIPAISLAHFAPNQQILDLIPKEVMTKRFVIPLSRAGGMLTVAVGDPFDLMALEEIQTLTGLAITPVVSSEGEITETIGKIFQQSTEGLDMEELMRDDSDVQVVEDSDEDVSLDEMLESAEGAPVIRMVNMMLVEALRTGASDIHIEPEDKTVRLRYRIDGKLVERPGPPKNLQNAVISRIKIMSDLDIAERRVPQDGRTHIKALGKEVDLRISLLPTVHGEKIVIRTLDKSKLLGGVDNLGLDPHALKSFKYALSQPNGIILVTGPTGSGKTMTLYSCLQDVNQPDTNIITCEDPVEFQIPGLNQVQIHADVGLTFGAALRSILRQDPDVILVGELRDQETSHIAIEAALTGHLVLATLHTNNAPQAVTRLIDMGIEPFMLGSCLVLAQAQRLYRRLCSACKKVTEIDPAVLEANNIPTDFFDGDKIYAAKGCPRCSNGYKGRGAAMEVLLVTDDVREAILRGANSAELFEMGKKSGMMTLKEAGLQRVKEGITSLQAALEVTGS